MPKGKAVPAAGRMVACPFRVTDRFAKFVREAADRHEETPGAFLDRVFAQRGGWDHES